MSENRPLSRSEHVRQRRRVQIQHQPRPPKKKSLAGSKSRENPPISLRGVVNEAAYERYQKTNKRRFNTSYDLPFANFHSLGLFHSQTGFGWRFLSVFIVLLLGAAMYMIWTLPEFRVTSPQITGNQRISAGEIQTMLGMNGRLSFLLAPKQIETRVLRDFPELQSISVQVMMPNQIEVVVTERQPLILWQQDGSYTWIDENGIAFRPHGEVPGLIQVNALSAPLPLETASSNPESPSLFISVDTVRSLQMISNFVPQGAPILYEESTGLSWIDPQGWRAIFGSGSKEISLKVRVYQSLVDWLSQRGIRPALINVTYPNAPYYRLDQGHAEE